jgi:hypothetical protein
MMAVNSATTSKALRLIVAIAYPIAVMVMGLVVLPRTEASGPLIMIALGLPLIFRLIPRNWIYGTRSLRTLFGTEETWYRQNVITGVAMVLIGIVWLGVIAVRALPN